MGWHSLRMTERPAIQTFIVGIDRAAALERRDTLRRAGRRGSWLSAAIGGAGIAMAVAMPMLLPGAGLWPFAALLFAGMIPMVLSSVQARRLAAAREQWYEANELPAAAMRMTPEALELACDGAGFPVVLPWAATLGFKQERRFGEDVLELVLAPGVSATTAGVRGLDQPAVRALVRPSPLLPSPGLYGVDTLIQPVDVIHQAIQHFSGGGAGISR